MDRGDMRGRITLTLTPVQQCVIDYAYDYHPITTVSEVPALRTSAAFAPHRLKLVEE